MLEEALSSTTHSPSEAALTFLSFLEVELAAGGASAEARFFKLFSLLCDRVFGEISKGNSSEGQNTNANSSSNSTAGRAAAADHDYRHLLGGWLGRHVKWERPSTPGSSRSSNPHIRIPHRTSSTSNSVQTDPVVKLLGARTITYDDSAKQRDTPQQQRSLSLIEAFAKEAEHRPNVRYPFPFKAFPKATQDAWLAILDTALGAMRNSHDTTIQPSENAIRLFGSLFRVKPLEQVSLRQYQQQKAHAKDQRRPLQLSPMQFQTRQPMSPATPQASSTPTKQKDVTSPTVSLSMLEYFLVIFIRYPLAPPPSQPPPITKTVRSGASSVHSSTRRTEPYGDTVYYQLFQEYTDYYVPHSFPQGHSSGFAPLQRPSELFIRIITGLWLEGQHFTWTTPDAVKAYKDKNPHKETIDLNASFDLIKTRYDPLSHQITRCLHKLVVRAVTDGALLDLTKDLHAGYRGANPDILCLSPTLTILQLPFYNYIRSAFRHASIHARQSPFYAALNDWLVWLEPWNTRHDKGKAQGQRIMGSVSRSQSLAKPNSRFIYPKDTQKSAYKESWEPYIASNLHLYTVPLAMFLRRSRELDFSPREYKRSLQTVRRVLRVFTPEVVAVIDKLLSKDKGKWGATVSRHEHNLKGYAPPSSELGLMSCQDDMQTLLEEIYLQHSKKVDSMDIVDRTIAKIEGFFGGGAAAGEEKEIRTIIRHAKALVRFGDDFEVIPSKTTTSGNSKNNDFDAGFVVDRGANGFLSEAAVERLSTGIAKCDPLEIGYVGDRMFSRPRSFEIKWLIPHLVDLSIYLNKQFDIKNKGDCMINSIVPRRFNLRFLADIRNVVFLWIVFWILKILC